MNGRLITNIVTRKINMADFCKDCSILNFGQDYKELAGIAEDDGLAYVLCEGCGFIYVNKNGERVDIAVNKKEKLSALIISFLNERKGFDDWWDGIEKEIQKEILGDMEELIFDFLLDNQEENGYNNIEEER
jgi:hypothetical protein